MDRFSGREMMGEGSAGGGGFTSEMQVGPSTIRTFSTWKDSLTQDMYDSKLSEIRRASDWALGLKQASAESACTPATQMHICHPSRGVQMLECTEARSHFLASLLCYIKGDARGLDGWESCLWMPRTQPMTQQSEQILTYITWLGFSVWNFLYLFAHGFAYCRSEGRNAALTPKWVG